MQSDNEDEIDKLMNGFDKEFKTPEEIKLTDNTGNVNVLTLEATVHAVDQCTTHTEELETKQKEKKKQKKVPQSHGNATFLHFLEKIVFLRAELPTNLTKVLQILIFMKKLLILILFQQYFKQA